MKDTSIEGTVLRNTLRVLKEMNLFQYMICAFSHHPRNLMTWVIKYRSTYATIAANNVSDNAFCNIRNYDETISVLKKLERNHDGEKEKIIQMKVMDCTNTLLHCCIERNLARSRHDIGRIGEQIFNKSCEDILGKGFKDLTDTLPSQADIERVNELCNNPQNVDISSFIATLRDMLANDTTTHYNML